MTIVRFGNTAPVQHLTAPGEDGEPVKSRTAIELPEGDDHAVTEFRIPDDLPLMEAMTAVTAPVQGAWDNHSDERPVWVSSDNDRIAELLAEHYSDDEHTCEVVPFEDETPVGVTPPDGDPEQVRAPRKSARKARRRASGDEQ